MTDTSVFEYAKLSNTAPLDRPAFWFYGRSISRSELYAYVDVVANNLYRMGVRSGTVVTIHLPTSPQAVISFYAVCKLGGICNIVHPLLPLVGLQKNMAFTKSNFLVTGSHFSKAELIQNPGRTVYVKLHEFMGCIFGGLFRIRSNPKVPSGSVDFQELLKPCLSEAICPAPSTLAHSCACYLNSSGTARTPKTIMHSHMALNNWVENAKQFFQGVPLNDHTVLSVLPMFHGSGLVMNIHQVLSCGGTQVLMAKWDSKLAVSLIKKHRVTILTGVPVLFRSLLNQKGFSGKKIQQISQCFVSGDYVSVDLKNAFNARVGKTALFEGYGMTEIVTACFANAPYQNKLCASGYPLVNCQIAIISEDGKLSEKGTGEFAVSTNTMMLGYLNASEDTENVFFEADGLRWYRTGDIGTIDDEGFVYFKERTQNVIVRKGYNIYPGEIEEIIANHSNICEACVVGIPSSAQSNSLEQIRAYIVLKDASQRTQTEQELRSMCNITLPAYATNIEFRLIDRLPRNQVSKVDRSYLRQLP